MKNVLWFSRHAPTTDQVSEISMAGQKIAAMDATSALAATPINHDDDLVLVLRGLLAIAATVGAVSVYGVFATPIMGEIANTDKGIPCYAAWNVSRTPDGASRPTFSHRVFVKIGELK